MICANLSRADKSGIQFCPNCLRFSVLPDSFLSVDHLLIIWRRLKTSGLCNSSVLYNPTIGIL